MIRSYKGMWPKLGERVYVDVSAQVIGRRGAGRPLQRLDERGGAWRRAPDPDRRPHEHPGQLRRPRLQGHCIPPTLGDHVTVGHSATLHGCRIDSYCLIGMGATVLNGAHVGEECIVAAGTVVPEGMVVPPRQLVMGVPGKVRRPLTEAEKQSIRRSRENYYEYKETYLSETQARASEENSSG